MKKVLFSSVALLLTAILFAQQPQHDGPLKPPPAAERWKHDSIKLQLYVIVASNQMSGVKNAFLMYYNEMDGLLQNKTARPAREEIEKIIVKRSNTLKTVLSTQQFDRFQTFEKEFMPPPPRPLRDEKKEAPEKV